MHRFTRKNLIAPEKRTLTHGISLGRLIQGLLTFAILTSSVFLVERAEAIERVAPTPEVGTHLIQGAFGIAGSSEDFAEGTGVAWSALYSYHANNPFGPAVAIGQNEPEDFDGINNKFTYFVAGFDIHSPTRSGFVPFLQALFGIYKIDFSSPSARIETNQFGMLFGGGVDFLVTDRVGVGVVGNLQYVSLDDEIQAMQSLGDWFNTWDIKGVVTLYIP